RASGYLSVPAHLAALTLGHPTPDSELLADVDGVVETLLAHLALGTDSLGAARGGASFGEEEVGVRPPAFGVVLPRQLFHGQGFDELALHLPVPLHACNYKFEITGSYARRQEGGAGLP